jgi:hypothetical protein
MMAEVSPRNPDDPDFDRIAPANLVDWMRQTRTLEHIAGFAWWDVNITGIEEPERVTGFRVTPEFFARSESVPCWVECSPTTKVGMATPIA